MERSRANASSSKKETPCVAAAGRVAIKSPAALPACQGCSPMCTSVTRCARHGGRVGCKLAGCGLGCCRWMRDDRASHLAHGRSRQQQRDAEGSTMGITMASSDIGRLQTNNPDAIHITTAVTMAKTERGRPDESSLWQKRQAWPVRPAAMTGRGGCRRWGCLQY